MLARNFFHSIFVIALCCCLAATGQATPQSSSSIEVERGRALLVTDSGVLPMGWRSGTLDVPGAGHFELAPASRATLHLGGRGTIHLTGPASMSWQGDNGLGELRFSFSAIREARVEVRFGPARIDLPGAWRARLEYGAISLHSLPGGGTELWNHAGRAVQGAWIGADGFAPPGAPVGVGQKARLQGSLPIQLEPDHSSIAPRWSESDWPWGKEPIEGGPDLAIQSAGPWSQADWPWDSEDHELEPWERWDWPWMPTAELDPDSQGFELRGAPDSWTTPNSTENNAPRTEFGGKLAPRGGGEELRQEAPSAGQLQDPAARPPLGRWTSEAEPFDAGPSESGPSESNPSETGTPETGLFETESSETGPYQGESSGMPASTWESDGSETTAVPHFEVESRKPQSDSTLPTVPQTDGTALQVSESTRTASELPAVDPSVESDPANRSTQAVDQARNEQAPPQAQGDSPGDSQEPTPALKGSLDLSYGFVGSPPEGFKAEHWRGLGAGMLMWNDSYALQRSSYLKIDEIDGGKRRVTLDLGAPEPVWYFDSLLDLRVFPGASIVIERDGSVRYCEGLVRTLGRDLQRRF